MDERQLAEHRLDERIIRKTYGYGIPLRFYRGFLFQVFHTLRIRADEGIFPDNNRYSLIFCNAAVVFNLDPTDPACRRYL